MNNELHFLLGIKFRILFVLAMLFSHISVHAQDRLEMDGTSIIGNKELPKVLYIVPWKSPEPLALSAPEISSVMDEVAMPVNRSGFRRQIQYHQGIYPPVDIQ